MTELLMMKGPHGIAWEDPKEIVPPFDQCSVARWLIEARWAHPVWSQYYLGMISLGPVPELGDDPVKYDPAATHEVQLFALTPDLTLSPGDSSETAQLLQPQNFVGQGTFGSDEEAREFLKLAISKVLRGELSPDTDFRRGWMDLFPFTPY
jgi:hypothetical protein